MPRHPATPPHPYQPNSPSVPTGDTGSIADVISAASESIPGRLSPTASEIGIENYDLFNIPPPVQSDVTRDDVTIHHAHSSMSIGLHAAATTATTTPEPAPSEPTKPFEILVWVTRPPKKVAGPGRKTKMLRKNTPNTSDISSVIYPLPLSHKIRSLMSLLICRKTILVINSSGTTQNAQEMVVYLITEGHKWQWYWIRTTGSSSLLAEHSCCCCQKKTKNKNMRWQGFLTQREFQYIGTLYGNLYLIMIFHV